MNQSIHQKRDAFAKQIRSEQKQAYFEKERIKLYEAQLEGNVNLEDLIMAELVGEFGSEENVMRMLAEYEAYEKSIEEFQKTCEEEEEASMNFQKIQEQQKLQQDKETLMKLFDELQDSDHEHNKFQQKDVEI